jgi:hypothetical protein
MAWPLANHATAGVNLGERVQAGDSASAPIVQQPGPAAGIPDGLGQLVSRDLVVEQGLQQLHPRAVRQYSAHLHRQVDLPARHRTQWSRICVHMEKHVAG